MYDTYPPYLKWSGIQCGYIRIYSLEAAPGFPPRFILDIWYGSVSGSFRASFLAFTESERLLLSCFCLFHHRFPSSLGRRGQDNVDYLLHFLLSVRFENADYLLHYCAFGCALRLHYHIICYITSMYTSHACRVWRDVVRRASRVHAAERHATRKVIMFRSRGRTLSLRRPNRAHGPSPRYPHRHGVVRQR